jgi:hypothetical protein
MIDYAARHRDAVISRAWDDWRMNRITVEECDARIAAARAAYDAVFG